MFDTTPGALDGTGTEADPFIIMSIEDLVYFSKQVNVEKNKYSGKYVKLGKTLDFNSDLSYINPNTTEYDEYLGGNVATGLKEQLTTGIGFRPIGENLTYNFVGNFDGNNHAIENIKVDIDGLGGLFGYIYGGGEESPTAIKNLTISGNISASNYAGGIVGEASYNYISLENLTNYANVTTSSSAGGIVGRSFGTEGIKNINKCSNYGNIISNGASGGIIGYGYMAKIQVENSANYGKLESTSDEAGCGVGGIFGGGSSPTIEVYNSCNYGTLIGMKRIGGINGHANKADSNILVNVFNVGEASTNLTWWQPGGLMGTDSFYKSVVNAYYISTYPSGLGNNSRIIGSQYTEEQLQASSFVDELNTNIQNGCPYEQENDDGTTTTVKIDTTGWAKWVYNKDDYPTLDTSTIWNATSKTWEKIEE